MVKIEPSHPIDSYLYPEKKEYLQKEVISTQRQPSCKKWRGPNVK